MTDVRTVDVEAGDGIDYSSLATDARHRFACRVATGADGSDVRFPVNVLVGRSRRPRLVCVAGIHGDEPEGVTTLLDLWRELDADALDGSLVLVPCANPPAVAARSRRAPEDGRDMNRTFPGDPVGTITERLCHHLLVGVAADADMVAALHSFGAGALTEPYVEFGRDSSVAGESRAAATAFGAEYVDAFEWPDGVFSKACTARDVPAIEPELGGLGATVAGRRRRYAEGVRNLLRHLGTLPGDPETPDDVTAIDRRKVAAPVGGVLTHHHDLGDEIGAGDPLATIRDVHGGTVATISSPATGVVGGQRRSGTVRSGERACTVFSPA